MKRNFWHWVKAVCRDLHRRYERFVGWFLGVSLPIAATQLWHDYPKLGIWLFCFGLWMVPPVNRLLVSRIPSPYQGLVRSVVTAAFFSGLIFVGYLL